MLCCIAGRHVGNGLKYLTYIVRSQLNTLRRTIVLGEDIPEIELEEKESETLPYGKTCPENL